MTPESEIKQLTIPEFANRIRSKYPAYKDLSDDDLTMRVLKRHPEYKSRVNLGSAEAAETQVSRAQTQFQNAQQAYQSAAGKKLNPTVSPGTDYFRPLTSTEQAAKKKGDPVVISEASQQPAITPARPSRPRKVTEPPVSLAPVIQGRLSEIQKQRRQQETQAKVEQARSVMKRRPGLIAQMEQAGIIQRPNPNQLIDKTVPKIGESLPSRPTTFAEDRAQRVTKKQAIGEIQQEAKKRGIRTAEIREGVKAELSRPETYSDEFGTRQRMSVPDPARVEAKTISRTQAAIAEHDRKQRVSKMGTIEYAAQLPKGPLLGLAGGAATSLKGLAAVAKKAVDTSLSIQGLDAKGITPDTKDTYVYQLGEYIEKNSREILRSNPDLEKEFFIGKAPEALGQSALFLLGGAVSQSPKLAISILGGTMTAGDAYDEVRARGGTDDEAINAGLLAGAILGPTELIGTRGLIKALEGKVQGAALKVALKNALTTGSKEGLENLVQEIGQEAGQGLITGNPRSLAELAEAGALGAISGAVGTGATTLGASGIDALRNRPATPDIVTEYLKASPLTTPEELGELEKSSTPSVIEPEQVTPKVLPKEAVSSTLDLKPGMRAKKRSIYAPSMGKPQQIQPDQIAEVRTAKPDETIPQIIPESPKPAPLLSTLPGGIELRHVTPEGPRPLPEIKQQRSVHIIEARSLTGDRIGRIAFTEEGIPLDVSVEPSQQRKGVASALYRSAEKYLGFELAPGEFQTPAGTSFRRAYESQRKQSKPDQSDTGVEIDRAEDFKGRTHLVTQTLTDHPLRKQVLGEIPPGSVLIGQNNTAPEMQFGAIRLRATNGDIWEVDLAYDHRKDKDWKTIGTWQDGFAIRKTGENIAEVPTTKPTVETPAELKTQPTATESQLTTVAPEVNLSELETRAAEQIRAKEAVPNAEYTSEGLRTLLGSREGGDVSQLVDVGLVNRTPEGRYVFNERVVEQATPKEVTDAVVESSVTAQTTQTQAREAVSAEAVSPKLQTSEERTPKAPSIEAQSPSKTPNAAPKLQEWGTRLKSIAQSKNLNDLQVLSDEIAAHKDDPRVAKLRTAIQDEIDRAKKSEPESGQSSMFAREGVEDALTRRGVRGDRLLDAADLADALAEKGGEIHPDGTVTLYHRTSQANARRILATRMMTSKEDGLFFGTHPEGQIEGYGEAVVQVRLPLEKLELNDVFPDEAHVRMPTRTVGKPIPINVESMFAKGEAESSLAIGVEANRIALDNQGAKLLSDALRERGQLAKNERNVRGSFEHNPEGLAMALDNMAEKGSAGAADLADAVRRAAKVGKGKIVLFADEKARKHELFHEASDKANRYLKDRHGDFDALTENNTFSKMYRALTAIGYPKFDIPTIVEESAAHIAEGRYEQLGLTREEAVDWMFKWFQSFEKQNPNVNPREFQELADEAETARNQVYAARAQSESQSDQTIPSVQEGREGGDRESIAAARESEDITESEAFKRWFGDSKVVDEDGNPLVVYHGTPIDFETFKTKPLPEFSSNPESAAMFGGATSRRKGGDDTGVNVMPVYLSIKNPLRPSQLGLDYGGNVAKAKVAGYDGEIDRLRSGEIRYRPFDASQIKSATGNRGTFDPNDPNILMARSEGRLKKIAAFKTAEGEFANYDVDATHRGRTDMFVVQKDKAGYIVRNAFVPTEMQRQGLASELYRQMNQESLKKTGKPLRSTQPRTLITGEVVHELTPDAIALWDSFVRKGEAEKLGEKNYRFLPEAPLFARSDDPWANLAELSEEFEQLANEPELAPGEKPRSLPQTLDAAGLESGASKGYLPESIVDDGLERAKQVISDKGIDGAMEFVRTGDGIEWASTGYEVSARLRAQESDLRAEGKTEEAEAVNKKRLDFLDDFAMGAVERGRSIVGIKAISEFSPDRMAYALNKVSLRKRKHGISSEEEAKITQLGEELGLLAERNKELEKRLAEATSRAKARGTAKTGTKPKKTNYQSVLDQQASSILQTLKPKVGKLDLAGLSRESEKGAVSIGIPALPGDAELIAQYAAAQLAKQNTVADLNAHLLSEFGQDIEQHLPKIRQRAYAIRSEARQAEMEASETEPKRRKTILSEIQKEIGESLTAIREAQKAQDRAVKAEKAAQAKSERTEARQQAKDTREAEHEARKQEIKDARAELKRLRREYKQASKAETKGYRETIKAQREAERKAELWDTPLRTEAIAARERLKDATDPKDPQTADDLIAVAAEKFLPTETGGTPRTGAADPAKVYRDLKDEFPALVTKKNQGNLYKKGYQRIQDATAAAREAARLRSATAESKRLWEELGIDEDAQAVLIRQADVRRETDNLRRKAIAEFNRVSRSRVGRALDETNALFRALMSSIDAPIGRQGWFALITHPIMMAKYAIPATVRGYGAIHQVDYERELENMKQHPRYQLAVKAGLDITELASSATDPRLSAEERFSSPLAEKLPHVRLSGQGYVLGMNWVRLPLFDNFAAIGESDGKTWEADPEFFEQAASFVNNVTGRGTMEHKAAVVASFLNHFFYSTRLNVSRFQMVNDLFNPIGYLPAGANPLGDTPGFRSYDPVMRKIVAQQVLRFAVGIGAVYLAAIAAGFKVEFDPEDPDSFLIRFRNTRWDITGGEAGTVRFMFRFLKSIKKTATGEEMSQFEQPDALVKRFLRYKLAPIPSGVIDAITGKDAIGQPANFTKFESPKQVLQENIIARRVTPMLTGTFIDTVSQEGWIGIPMTLPALGGFGVSSYPDRGIRALKNQEVVDLLESLKITSQSLLGQKTKDDALDKVIQDRIMEKVETLETPTNTTDIGKEKLVKERLEQIRALSRAEAAIAEPKRYAEYLKSKEGSESVSVLTDEETKTLTKEDLKKYREIYANAYVEMLGNVAKAEKWPTLTDDQKEKVLARIPRIAHTKAKIDLVKTKRNIP